MPEQDEQFNKQYKDLINEYRFVDLIEAHKTKRKIKAHDYLLFYGNYLSQNNYKKIRIIMYDGISAKDVYYEDNKYEKVFYGKYLLLRWYRSGLYNAYGKCIGSAYMLEVEAYDSTLYGFYKF